MSRPRIALIDPTLSRRLAVTAALASEFDVATCPDRDDPVRFVRNVRPMLAWIGVDRAEGARRLLQALRTDARPVARIALYDPEARLATDARAAPALGADGWCAIEGDAARLRAFAHDVLADRKPWIPEQSSGVASWVRRVVGRLR